MNDIATPLAAPPAGGLRATWNRIADRISPWVSDALLALCARFALGAIFFLSGRTKVEGFLNTALAGLQDVADGILRVIAFLEQRVREIQELIKRIETYLDIPFQISFPSAKVLLLITNGTAGVITGLTGATDKPTSASKVSAKALYVVGACPVLHDHEVYQPGDELELTAAEAARLDGKVAAANA